MQKYEQASSNLPDQRPDLPQCCGTGCVICVLDLADDVFATPAAPCAPDALAVSDECCNTGCLVCLRDYPELCTDGRAATLALLEAVEGAQCAAQLGFARDFTD